ncbi:uncharacterized protein LOC107044992 [Diachasma alloeum]|uniref:uncharacterized protein LOC107044992 n=1 Tax=Diachasma alloeum TaxID=454923 RepID=UPI0007382B5B|nr:uncharacterized protein LOC107044992 [Diachasma alloeum]
MLNARKVTKIIPLVGPVKEKIEERKLPTGRQASATRTLQAVTNEWDSAGIPVRTMKSCVVKLETLYTKWQNLRKNASRKRSTSQRNEEEIFQQNLDLLFDISHKDVMNTLTENQKVFFVSQRDGKRRGFHSINSPTPSRPPTSDYQGTSTTCNANSVNDSESPVNSCEGDDQEDAETLSLSQSTERDLSISTTCTSKSCCPAELKRVHSSYSDELGQPPPKKRKEIIDEVASVCDRIGISNSAAMLFSSTIIRSLGLIVNDYNLSCATFRRRRMASRKKTAEQLKSSLHTANVLNLHWDGKLLPTVDGGEKIERLPTVVTGLAIDIH